jgi:hypothetical protein
MLAANPSMHWVVCDTSGSEHIKNLLYSVANDIKCPFTYTTFPHGPKYEDYASKNSFEPLIKYMPKLYNYMMSHVPECDFVLNIEDDVISKKENPLPHLLYGFDDNTAAVVGVTFVRRLTGAQGRLQGNVGLMSSDYSEIRRPAFGFMMMRYEYSQMSFLPALGPHVAFDIVFGARVLSLGKCVKIAWNVKTMHYFRSKEGLIGYVDEHGVHIVNDSRQ